MDKPITVARDDFLQALVYLVNESGLPAFIISDVLRDMKASVDKIAQEQLQQDVERYRQQVSEQVAGQQDSRKPQRLHRKKGR